MSPAACLLVLALSCPVVFAQDEPAIPVFGTTVVIPSGLSGVIYHLHHNASKLPKFEKGKPRGTIYTTSLNIPTQDFQQGFPGVTKRFEWFAIDYTGKFWVEKPGNYDFSLTSDDGSMLYIDDEVVIDNNGVHPTATKNGSVTLSGGIHRIRVSYFQGPRFQVCLILQVAPPGEKLRVFSTDEFKPPPNPETWTYPDTKEPEKKVKPRAK